MSCVNEETSEQQATLQVDINNQEIQNSALENEAQMQSGQNLANKDVVFTGQDLFDINLDMVRLNNGNEVYVDFERSIHQDYSELFINMNGNVEKIDIPITQGYIWDLFTDNKDNVYCRIKDFSDGGNGYQSSLCKVYPSFEYIIESCTKVLFANQSGVVYIDENRGVCQYDFSPEQITLLIDPKDILGESGNVEYSVLCSGVVSFESQNDGKGIYVIVNPLNILDYKIVGLCNENIIRASDDGKYLIINNIADDAYTLYEIATGKETAFQGEWIEEMDSEGDMSFSVYTNMIVFFVPEQTVQTDSSFYVYETDLDGGNRIEVMKVLIADDYKWFYITDCLRNDQQIYFIVSQDDEDGENCSWSLYQYSIDTKKILLLDRKKTNLGFLGVSFDNVCGDIYVYQCSIDTAGYEPIYTIH